MATQVVEPEVTQIPAPLIPVAEPILQEEEDEITLEEFLEKFREAAPQFVWIINKAGYLRGYSNSFWAGLATRPVVDRCIPASCPITAVVFNLTGKRYPAFAYRQAAKHVHLSRLDTDRIANAADKTDRYEELRAKMTKIVGVS